MSLWTALHTRENIGKKNIEVRLSNIKQQQQKKRKCEMSKWGHKITIHF